SEIPGPLLVSCQLLGRKALSVGQSRPGFQSDLRRNSGLSDGTEGRLLHGGFLAAFGQTTLFVSESQCRDVDPDVTKGTYGSCVSAPAEHALSTVAIPGRFYLHHRTSQLVRHHTVGNGSAAYGRLLPADRSVHSPDLRSPWLDWLPGRQHGFLTRTELSLEPDAVTGRVARMTSATSRLT